MAHASQQADLAACWPRYEPSAAAPWNLRRVVHLHRRAGFAGTWSELARDLADGPQASIDRFLAGHAYGAAPADFETVSRALADAAVSSSNPQRLKAWWFYRMVFSDDPLAERLTLMWHNHFATSNAKLDSVGMMRDQNVAFRAGARKPFGELLPSIVKGPAVLVWLDADKNRAGHANENLGRELLELFTLGIGHYSEEDVQQAARALTGWRVVGSEFHNDEKSHDDGEKTILGRSGKFTGDDLLTIVLAHPATAHRLAWRICRTFLGESGVEPAALEALAAGLRERDLDVSWGVETVLRSQRFFSDDAIGTRIVGPPEYIAGAVRALECFAQPPSTLLLADAAGRMGQDLFYPPNVGGWNEGKSWLSSSAIVARSGFAAALVDGRLTHDNTPPDVAALVERHASTTDLAGATRWLGELLYGGLATETIELVVQEAMRAATPQRSPLATTVLLLLSRPEAYLG
ncbi:MAG TPA: DUF1800 domain-containing protein [Pirellulales bacterium]|nr:DUF1800 domain-containing protein [Pirellulales bacterium]